MKSHLQEGIDSVLLTSAAPAERGRRRGAAPAGNCPWNSCWGQLIVLEFLLGTAPCPWNSCWENTSPAPRAATGGAGAPHPSRGSRAARRGQGSSLHGQQDRRTLCQSQHPTIQASGSAQQLHSGIGSARAPLELRFCPKRPQKAAPPSSWAWHIRTQPGLLPGLHLPGQGGRAPSQPCSGRESSILHQENKEKALLGFSLGLGAGEGQEEGITGWKCGLEASPCAGNSIYVYILFPVGEFCPGIKPGFGIKNLDLG